MDPRHQGRRALIVVIDKLDRPAQEPAAGVHIVAPDLERGEDLLAGHRNGAGQRHAEADLDGLGGLRRRARQGDGNSEDECLNRPRQVSP